MVHVDLESVLVVGSNVMADKQELSDFAHPCEQRTEKMSSAGCEEVLLEHSMDAQQVCLKDKLVVEITGQVDGIRGGVGDFGDGTKHHSYVELRLVVVVELGHAVKQLGRAL